MTQLQTLKEQLRDAKRQMFLCKPLREYIGNKYHYWKGEKERIEAQIENVRRMRNNSFQKTYLVRHKVLHKGALIINKAIMYKRGENVCAIIVDMKSKRGDICSIGCDGYAPTIAVEAGEGSDYLNKKVKRDVPTEISFPDFKGWSVWSAMICKHSIYVCLIKDKK